MLKNTRDFPTGLIVCNVPETNGHYKLMADAFFYSSKAVTGKLLKALKADTFNAAENAKKLIQWQETEHHVTDAQAAPILKECRAIIDGIQEDSREQKKRNKAIRAFCSTKETRPVLQKPFISKGVLYATDSFIACKVKNRALYTGEFYDELNEHGTTPKMDRIITDDETILNSYIPVTLPDLSIMKDWGKAGKLTKKELENMDTAFFKASEKTVIIAAYLYRAMVLTGSNVLYINPENGFQPAYMVNDNFTCILLPVRNDKIKVPENDTCLFKYSNETGLQCLDCSFLDIQTLYVPAIKKPKKAKKPADHEAVKTIQAETKTNSAAASPAGKEFSNDETGRASADFVETVQEKTGIDFAEFNAYYHARYSAMYNRLINEYTSEYREKMRAFDHDLTGIYADIVKAFIQYRGDGITSDREVKAFMDTLKHFMPADTPEPAAIIQDESIEPKAEPAIIMETIQAETGRPESVTIQPAGSEKPVLHEEKPADAKIAAKTPKYGTFQLETVNNPRKADNTAGTQGNEPKTVYSRIHQNTETSIPLKPAGSMYPAITPTGVFRKYGHKSGTPPGYITLSALSAIVSA